MTSYPQLPRAGTLANAAAASGYGASPSRVSSSGTAGYSVEQTSALPRTSSNSGQMQNRGPSPSRPLPQANAALGSTPTRQPRYAPSAPPSSSSSSSTAYSAAQRPTIPSPSPPVRPLPLSRTAAASLRSTSTSLDPSAGSNSPPDTPPNSQPSHSLHSASHKPSASSVVHNRFHSSASSSASSALLGSSTFDARDDGYSPKRKKSVSAVTIFAFAGICFTLLLFLTYVSNNYDRWAWLAAARSASAATRLHALLPASSIHHPLIALALPPPLANLSAMLAAYQTLHKRLPFHPPMDQDHTQPPPPIDTPLAHPWYFPPPVTFTAIVPKQYERAGIHYVTNVTPKHLRKFAVPGTDSLMSVAPSEPQPSDPSTDSSEGDGMVNGVKVVAGVKVRPPVDGGGALEWTDKEKENNRRQFRNATLNQNLQNRVIWRPPVQTLAAATSKEFPPPVVGEEQYLFGDDYLWIVLTEKANHGLVRKIRSTWGQYVKHWLVYSDFYDSKLNTTVIKNPQPTWAPHDYKSTSWKVSAYIQHLAKHPEYHRPFYVVVDQYSFPLLDQVKWRFDRWRAIWKDQLPGFIAGRPDKRPFKFAYYSEQQQTAAQLFGEQLQVIPSYAYGFDHLSLMTMSYYTPVDICPPLSDDLMALAGLIQCAGGIAQEYHFLAMTRSNHREKGVTSGAELQQWRLLDVYSQTRTAGMLEEAFGWYYGALTRAVDDGKGPPI